MGFKNIEECLLFKIWMINKSLESKELDTSTCYFLKVKRMGFVAKLVALDELKQQP